MVSQLQSSLDYPDSLELEETVRMIEGPDNPEDEYKPIRPRSSEHSSEQRVMLLPFQSKTN